MADSKAHIPKERDQEVDEGVERSADRRAVEEHEVDV
jgi:hypothetical protein